MEGKRLSEVNTWLVWIAQVFIVVNSRMLWGLQPRTLLGIFGGFREALKAAGCRGRFQEEHTVP